MKKTTLAAICAAGISCASLLLTGCSGSNSNTESQSTMSDAQTEVSAASKAEAVLAEVDFVGEMVFVEADTMDLRLGFTSDKISDYAAYLCGSGAYPDEFGIFIAETSEKAGEIKASLEKRIENQKATYQDYTPDEMYKFDDCFVKQDGNTIYYAITADNSEAAELLG